VGHWNEHPFACGEAAAAAPGLAAAAALQRGSRPEPEHDDATCGQPRRSRHPAQAPSLFDAAVTELATTQRPAHVPPQNLEAEESVLGAMLLSPTAIGVVTELLDASDFYRESHGRIYRAALGLWGKGEPVDAITLVDELDGRGELDSVGGSGRIAELAALVPATSNVEHYARIVREMATLRGLVRVGSEIARLGQDRPGETADLVDRAEQLVFELAQQRVTGDFAHIEALLKESFERITHLYEVGADITVVPSGFRELDLLTSGFQPGNLIILAARPSMGKSALALCTAANLGVRHQTPVALFTLEMSKTEVTQRLMCSEAKVESQRLRSGKLASDDWPRLTAACDKLMKAPIFVDDTGSITMMELRSKARRLKSRQPDLGLIVVDYLQLMTTGASVENRVQEVSQISRQLKVLARDLEVPILALSQLSRAVEQRHDKRPILSDLRESGSIEQDADLVAFVYRDEYYNGEESEQQGLAEVILAKHRNGPTDTVKLSFLKRYAKFADLAAA
jgi:replicative DNA helicase